MLPNNLVHNLLKSFLLFRAVLNYHRYYSYTSIKISLYLQRNYHIDSCANNDHYKVSTDHIIHYYVQPRRNRGEEMAVSQILFAYATFPFKITPLSFLTKTKQRLFECVEIKSHTIKACKRI